MNTNTANTTILKWATEDLFAAELMFPTAHFEDKVQLEKASEEQFTDLIIDLLTPLQPLANEERISLAKSVKSGNRLRVYYQAMSLAKRGLEIIKDTQSTTIPAEASLDEVMGSVRAHRVSDGSTGDILESHELLG